MQGGPHLVSDGEGDLIALAQLRVALHVKGLVEDARLALAGGLPLQEAVRPRYVLHLACVHRQRHLGGSPACASAE